MMRCKTLAIVAMSVSLAVPPAMMAATIIATVPMTHRASGTDYTKIIFLPQICVLRAPINPVDGDYVFFNWQHDIVWDSRANDCRVEDSPEAMAMLRRVYAKWGKGI